MNSVGVSVVIPCYRCKETIGRALESIFLQKITPSEIILVDDASNDGTLEELHKFSEIYIGRLIIVQMKYNLGAAAARNAGWAIATQPYIAFLDSDDSWHPEKLNIQYEYMLRNLDVALCGHQCVFLRKNQPLPLLLSEPCETRIKPISMIFGNAFSTPTVMLKRDIPFRFQEGLRYLEDLKLWQQIAFAGLLVVRIESPLAFVHKSFYGSGGLSAQLWKMEKGELKNLYDLYKAGSICFLQYTPATLFSIIKFLKRVLKSKLVKL